MDLLTGLLVGWVAFVAVIYFGLQKLLEYWPNALESLRLTQPQKAAQKVDKPTGFQQATKAELLHAASPHQPTGAGESKGKKPAEDQLQSGAETDSVWLNEVIAWLYRYYRTTPEFVTCWIRSLNEASKKVANSVSLETAVHVELRTNPIPPPSHLESVSEEPADEPTWH